MSLKTGQYPVSPPNQNRNLFPKIAYPPHSVCLRSHRVRELQCCNNTPSQYVIVSKTGLQRENCVSQTFDRYLRQSERDADLRWRHDHSDVAAWVAHAVPPVQLVHIGNALLSEPRPQAQGNIPVPTLFCGYVKLKLSFKKQRSHRCSTCIADVNMHSSCPIPCQAVAILFLQRQHRGLV